MKKKHDYFFRKKSGRFTENLLGFEREESLVFAGQRAVKTLSVHRKRHGIF